MSGSLNVLQLANAAALAGSDVFYCAQGDNDRQASAAQIATFVQNQVGSVSFRTVHLTSAQLSQLFTSPATIVPAPGAGNIIVYLSALYIFHSVTTPYDISGTGSTALFYGNGSGIAFDSFAVDGLCESTQPSYSQGLGDGSNIGVLSAAENQPIVLAGVAGNMTGGDGTMTITMAYLVSPVS